MEVLETQLLRTRHGFNGESWGADVFPEYGGQRADRAAKWGPGGVSAPAKKGQRLAIQGGDPIRVPDGVPVFEVEKQQVCRLHSKPRCEGCTRRKSKLAACCTGHHREGDGLAVKMCRKHRMTACSTCGPGSVAACCKNSHHKCLIHELPTCDACMRIDDVRSRRPKQCCKRGHHGARQGVKRGPVDRRADVNATLEIPKPEPQPQSPQWATQTRDGANGPSTGPPDAPGPPRKRDHDGGQAGGDERKKPKPQRPPVGASREAGPQPQPRGPLTRRAKRKCGADEAPSGPPSTEEERTPPTVDSPHSQPKRSRGNERTKAGIRSESDLRPRVPSKRGKRKCVETDGSSDSSTSTADVKRSPETSGTHGKKRLKHDTTRAKR
jgi:hypothetical protein